MLKVKLLSYFWTFSDQVWIKMRILIVLFALLAAALAAPQFGGFSGANAGAQAGSFG